MDCAHCEELLQPYVDRALSPAERAEAEKHLEACDGCRKRYHFEESLRGYLRRVYIEEIPLELKQKLAALRTPLL